MTKDPSQGVVPDPKVPTTRPVAEPDGPAILREIQRDVDTADRAVTKRRPAQDVGGKQDWRRG